MLELIHSGFFSHLTRQEQFYSHCLGWKLKFALLPRKCFRTRKYIWLELAYKGIAMWTGPDEPIFETQWHKKDEHLIWTLKK